MAVKDEYQSSSACWSDSEDFVVYLFFFFFFFFFFSFGSALRDQG